MSYSYSRQRSYIFSEEGQVIFLKIRDHISNLLKSSGAFTMGAAMSAEGVSGDSWNMMACVDRLVELKEIQEIPQDHVCGQDRVFIRT